ncbi:MAG: DUF790 family protein [Thermoprotei archaeon]
MLRWELARFEVRGNRVYPKFSEDYDVAEEVLSLFEPGRKVGEVEEDVDYLAKIYDPKLVRAFFELVVRILEKGEESPVPPINIRRQLFERGPALTEEERERVIQEVRKGLGVDPDKYMFSDLEEELVVKEKPKLTAEDLVKWYNLSLLQTLLFRAYRMTVYVGSNWKEIVRRAKWLGLMYFAYDNPLRLDFVGPATLVKMTEKYGRNFAVLLPYVVSARAWRVEAEITLGKSRKRVYKLDVHNYPNLKAVQVEEERFDSSVERKFFTDFQSVAKDWNIVREPRPLVVGDKLFIPDFLVEKGKIRVYVEIVGFWTREYVREKLEKLSGVKEPILVLLNEELAMGDFSAFNVIKFRKYVDVSKVVSWLRKLEEREYSGVKEVEYMPKSEVVPLKEVAAELGLPVEVVRKSLRLPQGYRLVGNYVVSEGVIERLRKEELEGKRLSELRKSLGNYVVDLLPVLGYKLMWRDLTDAVVKRG